MKMSDVRPGMTVLWVPHHANGDRRHPDSKYGIVSSANERYVFVKFDVTSMYGQACEPGDLIDPTK